MKNITLTSEQTSRYKKYRAELPFKLLATFEASRMLFEIKTRNFTRSMDMAISSYFAKIFSRSAGRMHTS